MIKGQVGGNRRKKTILTCMNCGKKFYSKSGSLKQKMCSRDCKNKSMSKMPSKKKGKRYPHLDRAEIRKCITCGKKFKAVNDFDTKNHTRKQIYCSHKCYLINRRISYFEIAVGDYLESLGIVLERQIKVKRWVFDFAIKDSKIFIEADGSFWHSLKPAIERDKRKNEWCKNNGYELYRIDELEFRKDKKLACDVIVKRFEDYTGIKGEIMREVE